VALPRRETGMEGSIGIGPENVDEAHEPIRCQNYGPPLVEVGLEPQLPSRPGAKRIDDPIAVGAIELSTVLQDLPPGGVRNGTELMPSVPESRQCLLFERLGALIRPPDDAARRRNQGGDIPQEGALHDGLPISPRLAEADQAE